MGKKILPLMLAGCIFLGGCALLVYPKMSQWLNNRHQSEVIADYSDAVDSLDDEEAQRELKRAEDYNDQLTETVALADPFETKFTENDQYSTLLNFTVDGVMGYIEIPKINVLLPIYPALGRDPAGLSSNLGAVHGHHFDRLRSVLPALYRHGYCADPAGLLCRRAHQQYRQELSQELRWDLSGGLRDRAVLHYFLQLCHHIAGSER